MGFRYMYRLGACLRRQRCSGVMLSSVRCHQLSGECHHGIKVISCVLDSLQDKWIIGFVVPLNNHPESMVVIVPGFQVRIGFSPY